MTRQPLTKVNSVNLICYSCYNAAGLASLFLQCYAEKTYHISYQEMTVGKLEATLNTEYRVVFSGKVIELWRPMHVVINNVSFFVGSFSCLMLIRQSLVLPRQMF